MSIRRVLAMRDKDGRPIPGIPDGTYDLEWGEPTQDGDLISYPVTITPVLPPPPTDAGFKWLEEL